MSKNERSSTPPEEQESCSKRLKLSEQEPNKSQENGDDNGSITSFVAAHYNTIEEKGLSERNKSRIVYLRNFNNWIKSMLINEYLLKFRQQNGHDCQINVLDIGCGKGGDLLKWKNNNINHLICADVAQVSVEQCQQRYNEMKNRGSYSHQKGVFTAEFITADCTKVRLKDLIKHTDLLDIVSCQFAFHYCFESQSQAECMLRNVAESLRPGGFFIGSIPDANDIVIRLKNSNSKSFGNDVFKIQFDFESEDTFPLFGAKYEFFLEDVVNCPEFLVYFPALIKLASKFGLKFVAKERFQDYYLRMKEEGRGLLGRMQGFETYPSFENIELMGKPEEYKHADDYLKKHTTTSRVGTLSRSEWEAATVYMVFAFQKVDS